MDRVDVIVSRPSSRTSVGGAGVVLGQSVVIGSAPAPQTTTDTFTDGTEHVLSSHTPDADPIGGGWTTVGAQPEMWTESSNNLAHGGTSGQNPSRQSFSRIQVASADGVLTCRMRGDVGVNRATFLLVRVTDSNNYWYAGMRQSWGQLRLYEVNAGSSTLRSSVSYTVSHGTWVDCTATLSGSSITVVIDGKTLSYGSATFNQTEDYMGIRVLKDTGFNGGVGAIDDFVFAS